MKSDSSSYPLLGFNVRENTKWMDRIFSITASGDTVELVDSTNQAITKMSLAGTISFDEIYNTYSTLTSATLNTYSTLVKANLGIDGTQTGSFEYNDLGVLSGTFKGEQIDVSWNNKYNIAQYKVNNVIVALLLDLPDTRTLFIDKNSQLKPNEIMQLVAVYDFVFMEQSKLIQTQEPGKSSLR